MPPLAAACGKTSGTGSSRGIGAFVLCWAGVATAFPLPAFPWKRVLESHRLGWLVPPFKIEVATHINYCGDSFPLAFPAWRLDPH